ncbi:MAG: HEAT repeat domain-containing protein [Spirochaetes bacterium]|nr:HEAT repeat domain-containing protein [Spirochaetota bacterium]
MKQFTFSLILAFLLPSTLGTLLWAEEGSPSTPTASQTPQDSILEERKQVFQYGTEGEILDLLKTLQEQKDRSMMEQVLALLDGKISRKLTRTIFDFLRNLEYADPKGEGYAKKLLQTQEDLDQETILSLLQYLSLPKIQPQVEVVLPFLKDSRRRIVTATVRYLGKKGNEGIVPQLIDLFKGQEAEEDLRTSILTALGELKANNAVEFLRSILDNPDERLVYRRFACDALGKIGAKEAYPSIKKALEESDNLLRAYAVSAIGAYPESEVEEILLKALRDDFSRVRGFAAEQLGNRKSVAAVEMLIYRVRRDSDKQVRLSSLKALFEIGSEKSFSFLQDLILDDKASLDLRVETIRLFLQNPSDGLMKTIRTLMEREWTKENSRLLDETCKQLSIQTLSGIEDVYQKMLSHRSFIIRVYGIRGIGRNGIRSATDQLRQLAKEGASPQEKKEARLVLEQWGVTP